MRSFLSILLFLLMSEMEEASVNQDTNKEEIIKHRTKDPPQGHAIMRNNINDSGYFDIGGDFYYIGIVNPANNRGVNWFEAADLCQSIGMQMVSLQTQPKNELLLGWLKENYGNWVWTSGKREKQETDWEWVSTGESFTYLDWDPKEPDLSIDVPACVNLAATYAHWVDDECDVFELSYMCEVPNFHNPVGGGQANLPVEAIIVCLFAAFALMVNALPLLN